MSIDIIFGIILIAIGAFSAGSFAVPFGKIKGWQWETYWMVFSFAAYILFPLIFCLILSPGFVSIIKSTPSETLLLVFILGAVYGIANFSFGLALRYLGLSLGYALSLGLMMAIGTLIPPLIDGRLQVMLGSAGGNLLIAGIIVAAIGIAFSSWAGILKDKTISQDKKLESVSEFHLVKGLSAALFVGLTGSALSLGFEQGLPISELAGKSGVSPLFTMMPVYLVILSGTFISSIIWCFILGIRNRSIKNYVQASTKRVLLLNYSLGILAGLLWFSQYILYGMGRSKMGPFTFTSWGILMALIIVSATIWGLIRKEWKGVSKKIYILLFLSLTIIIVAAFMIGISGSV